MIATTPHVPHPNYRRRRVLAAVVAVWVAVVAVGVGLAVAHASGGGSGPSDSAWVAANGPYARSAVASVAVLQIETGELAMRRAAWRIGKLSRDAADTHTNLDAWREHLLTGSNLTDPAQLRFVTAENDLKRAVGALGQWADAGAAGAPSGWVAQETRAAQEWNRAVTVLWRSAGAGAPPLFASR